MPSPENLQAVKMEDKVSKFIPCLILSCLQYTDIPYYFHDELTDLKESDMFESISDSLMHFYIAYDAEYKSIIEKVFDDQRFTKSKSRFLAKIGSRCLKMSQDPTFFNFLLMCAFVGRVVSFYYANWKCYMVAEVACKCAVAVFKRKFLEFFNQKDGLRGLWTYSDCLNETVLDLQDLYEDLGDILTPDLNIKQHVSQLLSNCRDIDSTEYFLTDFFERKLVDKVANKNLKEFNPSRDCLIFDTPRAYWKIQNNQNRSKLIPREVDSNINNIESCARTKFTRLDNSSFKSCPNSTRIEPDFSPSNDTIETESKPLNYSIYENESESSNNIAKGSIPSIINETVQDKSASSSRLEDSHPICYDTSFSVKRKFKREFDQKYPNLSQPKGVPDITSYYKCFQVETVQKEGLILSPKRPKLSNSPKVKLLLADVRLHRPQFLQTNLASPQTVTSLQKTVPSFVFQSSTTNNNSLSSEVHMTIHKCPSSYSSSCHFPLDAERRNSLITSIESPCRTLDNTTHSAEDKFSPSRFHQYQSSLAAKHEMPATRCSSSHCEDPLLRKSDWKENGISVCSSTSEYSPSSENTSEGYFTCEGDVSDGSDSDISPLNTPLWTSSDNSPSDTEFVLPDWKGGVTLNSLINHKCFHCSSKCFSYIMDTFQQFTNEFLD